VIVVNAGGFKGDFRVEVFLNDVVEAVVSRLDIKDGIGSFADEFVVEPENLIKGGVVKFIFLVFGGGF
jgi:hypothetical protein